MRTQFTLVKRHDTGKWQVALGPESVRRDHRKYFKALRIAKEHPEFSAVAMALPIRTVRLGRPAQARTTPVAPQPIKKAVAKAVKKGKAAVKRVKTAFSRRAGITSSVADVTEAVHV